MASDPLKTDLGGGHYEAMVKLGLAAGMSDQDISRLAKASAEEIVEMRAKYAEEIGDLSARSHIANSLFRDLATVRAVSLHMKLLDHLFVQLENGELTPALSSKLFQYLDKQLRIDVLPPSDEVAENKIGDDEIHERALRLLKSG